LALFVLAAPTLFLVAPGTVAASDALARVMQPLNDYDGAAVERAKAGAAARLQNPTCLKLLTDFTDQRGRTLDKKLESWGMSAADYLMSIPFRDGAPVPLCQKRRIELVTGPGTFPVFVCPAGVGHLNSRFAHIQVRDPALAEYMVIHEFLHTLGLGENPPTTFEITEQVRERCR
jgi:hypothetical protein